ncbi:pyridine nucleotide-disulfide oxidoreductase domain-containing protein 1 [Phlebotomus argentipes]|uniref:pyridine nucleotide-disulfide oxidoreductase domain-containing protein 1 n=1 Tax=Phlebotomus argentipes TaxID=94469 RepID=UPI002893583F|nr:pyridine nucleotide-disulfide oxidoreductase domain-containing protein 1 [Phlebotomus argentipes]
MGKYQGTFVIVGGGIAGVSCAETIAFYCPEEKIVLLTESSLIKAVTQLVSLGKALTRFEVVERSAETIGKCVQVVTDKLSSVRTREKIIITEKGHEISYKYLCLCTGARPKVIEESPNVIGIRDTESVEEFQRRIKDSERIVLVGNGGIASEIAFEVKGVAIDWVIKDNHMSSTFLDPGAAEFFRQRLQEKQHNSSAGGATVKRMRYGETQGSSGAALGPDWHRMLDVCGNARDLPDSVSIHSGCEVRNVRKSANGRKLSVDLTNGRAIECDFVVSATGVDPRIDYTVDSPLERATDGGISVNELMRTSVADIFAAGDCCTASWTLPDNWFQMRLWTQARQMGMMAGKAMAMTALGQQEQIVQDFCFEFFGHVTKLFGLQVVLLGRYNGQGLGTGYEALVRVTPNQEYIKLVLVGGRLQGAILIGETGLEETFENLLLNQLDLTPFGADLLDPNIDIEDYFD